MKEKLSRVWKRAVSAVLALSLLAGLVPAAAPALAAGEKTVTVSIEKSTGTGANEFLLLPTAVTFTGTLNTLQVLRKAYAPKTIKMGSIFSELTVQDETATGGVIADQGLDWDENHVGQAYWLAIKNSINGESAMNRLKLSANDGDVIRLIYTTNKGEDVRFDPNVDNGSNAPKPGAMQIKKDQLLKLMAQVDQKNLPANVPLMVAWQRAKSAALSNQVSQGEVDAAAQQLYTVLYPPVAAAKVTISPSSLDLKVNRTQQLTAKIEPDNATDEVSWSTSDAKVAKVSASGLVTAVGEGQATITATAGSVSDSITVTVTRAAVESVTLDKESASLTAGDVLTLNAAVLPSEAADQLTWSSSDPTVANVSGGRVVGLKAGSTTITAAAGGQQDTCQITVTARDQAADPTIYLRHNDGQMQKVEAGGVIELTLFDSGSFVMEGYQGTPYWSGDVEGDPWVGSRGDLYLAGIRDNIPVTVYTHDPALGGEKIAEFSIKVNSAMVEDFRLYVGSVRVDGGETFVAQGSESYVVTAKARLQGESYYRTVPTFSYNLTIDNFSSGTVNDISKSFTVDNGKQAAFTARMVDGSANASFSATSSWVSVEDIEATAPALFYIDAWNGLGNQYVGVQPGMTPGCVVKAVPENASDPKLNWTSLDPDIAFYQGTYLNGIVPVKAGTASFTISSNESLCIQKTITLEFQYKYPLQQASMDTDHLTVTKGTVTDLKISTVPENATEQRFVWSYEPEGIVQIEDTITTIDTSQQSGRVTVHSMLAKKNGTVTVTGTPMDVTGGAQPLVFTVTVTDASGGGANRLEEAKAGIDHGLDYLLSDALSRSQYGDEWTIFAILRAGGQIPAQELEAYYASVCQAVKDTSLKPTDRARIVMALLAMGKDPTNVGGVDLIEQMYNDQRLKDHPSNMLIWTLVALDAGAFTVPEDALWDRNDLVNYILPYQKSTGGFGLSSENVDSVDVTAMAVQALHPYRSLPEVNTALRKALAYLQDKLTLNAGYVEGGSENSCSASQVLIALTSMGMDPLNEETGFTMGSNDLVKNLLSFKANEGFHTYAGISSGVKAMSTQQAVMALEAYVRLLNGQNSLFDLTGEPEEPDTPGDGDNGNTGGGDNAGSGDNGDANVPGGGSTGGEENTSGGSADSGGDNEDNGSDTPVPTPTPAPAPVAAAGGEVRIVYRDRYVERDDSEAQEETEDTSVPAEEEPAAADTPVEIPVVGGEEMSYTAAAAPEEQKLVWPYVAGGAAVIAAAGAGIFIWRKRIGRI